VCMCFKLQNERLAFMQGVLSSSNFHIYINKQIEKQSILTKELIVFMGMLLHSVSTLTQD
jgi:hypothetical protein